MANEKSNENKAEMPDSKASTTPAEVKDELVVTEHEIVIAGQVLHYTATTGVIVMKDEEGKAKAKIFFIAYTKKDVVDVSTRPLTISFNGGPGSSSVWLHLGVLGPKRVLSGDVDKIAPPPYRLTTNEYTLLQSSDLVFVDPVSTGYSRPAPGEEAKQFHGLQKDIASVGDFIRLYVTRYQRWNSPKFLIGESYGTTRAAGLAGYLQDRHGMYLNGLMLVSVILDFQTARFDLGNDLPFLLFLPTYAATALYHNKVTLPAGQDVKAFLAAVEAFAQRDYALALLQGDRLPAAERQQLVQQLAAYTGLTPTYIEETNLRIEIHRFVKELLRSERRTVGRLDTRFQGVDRDAAGENFEFDPSYAAIQGPYTATLNDYVRRDLNFASDLPYEILTGLYETWDYSSHQNQYVNVAETLRSAMSKNPFLRVLVANGYYDLATPYFATEYTFHHLALDATLQRNIVMTYYAAGHMMYLHEPSLIQLSEDLHAFIAQEVAADRPEG